MGLQRSEEDGYDMHFVMSSSFGQWEGASEAEREREADGLCAMPLVCGLCMFR